MLIPNKLLFMALGVGAIAIAIAGLRLLNLKLRQPREAEAELLDQLEYEANHDPLTGLLNRRSMTAAIDEAIADKSNDYCLLMVDVDDFKGVNDRLGHLAGDCVLKELANILKANFALASRWSGDEFVILVAGDIGSGQVAAELIRRSFCDLTFEFDGETFSTTLSVGLRKIDPELHSGLEGVVDADMALYEAKRLGKNRISVWRQGLIDEKVLKIKWYSEIESALRDDRFLLDYQEIRAIAATDTDLESIEVLLRMVLPNGRVVYPGDFIPFAERYGLSSKIDRWVVQWAMACACQCNYRFFVNLSSRTLTDPVFEEFLSNQPVPRNGQITFEITETAAVQNLAEAKNFIISAKLVGYRFALDDFGSGEASLSRLIELEGLIDYIKIDGYFCKNLLKPADSMEYQIASKTILYVCEVSRIIGAKAIAEFVENQEILDKLFELGCDYGQGWGIGSGPGEFPGKPRRIWWCAMKVDLQLQESGTSLLDDHPQ